MVTPQPQSPSATKAMSSLVVLKKTRVRTAPASTAARRPSTLQHRRRHRRTSTTAHEDSFPSSLCTHDGFEHAQTTASMQSIVCKITNRRGAWTKRARTCCALHAYQIHVCAVFVIIAWHGAVLMARPVSWHAPARPVPPRMISVLEQEPVDGTWHGMTNTGRSLWSRTYLRIHARRRCSAASASVMPAVRVSEPSDFFFDEQPGRGQKEGQRDEQLRRQGRGRQRR